MKGRSALVVGGGVAGMAAAIRLARAGVRVRLLERAATLGGKLREVEVGGKMLPAGPSVFTMREVFEELFGGKEALAEHLQLEPVDPLCRHFFSDGSRLDLFTDAERTREAIRAFSGERDARGYMAFREHAQKIHGIVRGPFMERPLAVFDLLRPSTLLQITQIDGMRTMYKAIESFFADPRLRQLFGRYATYNGSSPFHAPATLSVIAHVENAYGIFVPRGGIYRLAEALQARLRALDVEIETGVEIEEIVLERGRAVGVRYAGKPKDKIERADVVVSAVDVAHLYDRLLGADRNARRLGEKYADEELSLSAYVLMAIVDRSPLDLVHHNVFFSRDYEREFDELITQRRPPQDPTVYLCADDRVGGEVPATERAFLLSNAPPRDERGRHVDWKNEAPRCKERIVATLARHGWKLAIRDAVEQTPLDFAERFPSSRGALYGLASNSKMAAFKRPPNQIPGIAGLYLVGGTVHPGAGLPMVCLSARIACNLALEELHGR
jgi:1-hydroxycarotenoid 3,4-desaturase